MSKNKKRVTKTDVGYGVKVKALDDMGLKNSEFDNLNDMFGVSNTSGVKESKLMDMLNDDLWDGINDDEF
jgi:hypothetical protein|tara:strand:+ start:247 stop:456 length:210 start_codon:yes stop_codon:yes gene_type:complete